MLNHLKNEAGFTRTENNAIAHASTESKVLNLFALGGALRQRTKEEVRDLLHDAWTDNDRLALRAIMFLSDIRQGQGERDFFKTAIDYIIQHDPKIAEKLLEIIPEYSRWDLVYQYADTKLENSMFQFVKKQFLADLETEKPSLLGKWLKSVNTSSKESVRLGRKTAKAFGMTEKEYRKALASLRAKIDVVEKSMSAQEWDKIDLRTLPGKAYSRYMQAWQRHIPVELEQYLEDVAEGKVQMKTSVLYPHDVMKDALRAYKIDPYAYWGSIKITLTDPVALKSAELQWKNLPDYVDGDSSYIIPIIDTSGSMGGQIDKSGTTAMLVAKSLGIYLAERLEGPFKNHYITFSENPILAELKGEDIARKYFNMKMIVANTNLEKVFSLILNTAIKHGVSAEEMPSKIVIFSDMEFDEAIEGRNNISLYESFKERFENSGYELPEVIFWNLYARNDQFPVQAHESGTALVSGYSPVTMKYMFGAPIPSPYETMVNVLDQLRYAVLDELFE
jgi:hypothetical protein